MAEPSKKDSPSDGSSVDLGQVIERAKRELEHMMDLNPQVMVLVNAEGEVVRVNRALLDFLRIESFGDVLGKPLFRILPGEDEAIVTRLLNSDSDEPQETSAVFSDGIERLLRLRVVRSGRDSELQIVTVDDITLQKAESAKLEKNLKKEAVEALMGALMHSINQHLTVIMVTSRLMHLSMEKGTYDPEEIKKNLEEIMDLTMKIARLLDQAKSPKDYITREYLDGMDILDIERSSEEGEASPDQ